MRTIAVLAALSLATPAIAAEKAAEAPKVNKICKKIEPPTGSRMGIRTICKSPAEWEAGRLAAQRDLELRQRSDFNASEVNGPGEAR